MTLVAVHEDCDREEVIPESVACGPERWSAPLPKTDTASAAFPQLEGRESVDLGAAAFRTIGLPLVIGPPDLDELGMRFLIRHARNSAHRERPCGCGEEEMLRHRQNPARNITEFNDGRPTCQRPYHRL